jgi:hypothetical protein
MCPEKVSLKTNNGIKRKGPKALSFMTLLPVFTCHF